MNAFPASRVRRANNHPVRPGGGYVLYWMVSARRLSWNFALDRAIQHARELALPLVILEALRVGYRWASDRHHAFALDGMRAHSLSLAESPILYHPYVEDARGAGKGLLDALAGDAAVVVTDDFPAFFHPRMLTSAAAQVPVCLEAVDGNGLLPMAVAPKAFSAAYHFRRFLQRELPDHLLQTPDPDPLTGLRLPSLAALPEAISSRWPSSAPALRGGMDALLASLPIDHSVARTPTRGGTSAASAALDRFLRGGLGRYAEERNHPDAQGGSGLSPYLHWGHVSAHEIFARVASGEGWAPTRLGTSAQGRREGWWGMSPNAEAFLDQLVTWRELGFAFCRHQPDYDRYETLPAWARETLELHASDPRAHEYDLADLDAARTDDDVWNAAQRQLREEGTIHNYLRMLWGKKILEWSPHPRDALEVMIELNNRYALDGRDPNSYSGIFWVMGRFDRGWPARPVFGKVRSMTTASTRRKVRLSEYLRRWGAPDGR